LVGSALVVVTVASARVGDSDCWKASKEGPLVASFVDDERLEISKEDRK
jgi:hypothetical protein